MVEKKCQSNAKTSLRLPQRPVGYLRLLQNRDAPVKLLNLNFIGKLRVDANLRYLYTGEQKKLGTPRKYDGKVDCHDLSRLNFVKDIKPGVSLYTLVVWSCCLNCKICESLYL